MFEKDFILDYTCMDKSLHLSNYGALKIMQEIACLHSSAKNLGFENTNKTGLAWIILDWKLKVFSRPGWNSKVHVKTWPSGLELAFCCRDFEMIDETGNLVAVATSKWILFDLNSQKIARIDDNVRTSFQIEDKHVFEEDISRLREPIAYESSFDYTILRRDIDSNMHVNNLNYLLLSLEVLPEDIYKKDDFSQVEIMYKKQCFLGASVCLLCHKESESSYIIAMKSADRSILHALIRLKN